VSGKQIGAKRSLKLKQKNTILFILNMHHIYIYCMIHSWKGRIQLNSLNIYIHYFKIESKLCLRKFTYNKRKHIHTCY